MGKEIDLNDYELLFDGNEAYARAAKLLGLAPDSSEKTIEAYIDSHHDWYRNDEEWQYLGYDCGDCYMGGDVKKCIVCGDCLIVYAASPSYKWLHIYKKK